jgi:hypothetical protein
MSENNFIAKLADDKRNYQPGEELVLGITWDFGEPLTKFEVRLVWNTEGKGDRDLETMKTITLAAPGQSGQELVRTQLPYLPYSYRGKLLAIVWAVEVIAFPSKQAQRLVFEITPEKTVIEVTETSL